MLHIRPMFSRKCINSEIFPLFFGLNIFLNLFLIVNSISHIFFISDNDISPFFPNIIQWEITLFTVILPFTKPCRIINKCFLNLYALVLFIYLFNSLPYFLVLNINAFLKLISMMLPLLYHFCFITMV